MFCAISGEVPQEPVVSKKTGHLYEKRIVEKYINAEGKCPISGCDMTMEDLLTVQANTVVRPRPAAASSIPGLLAMFQNEWDEVMLETFTLKQHLDATRQELSYALYQHDAACRVIARLMRERDEAVSMLTALDNNGKNSKAMEVENDESVISKKLSNTVLTAIERKCQELSSGRKARGKQAIAEAVSKEYLSNISVIASHSPHKSDKPGINCLAVKSSPVDGDIYLTGGNDKNVIISNLAGTTIATLSSHTKKVNDVAFHPDLNSNIIFTASADKTVKIWDANNNKYSVGKSISHNSEVTSISVHPSGDFLISTSESGFWNILDTTQGISLVDIKADHSITCGGIHPDGVIFTTGQSSGALKMWDIREQKQVGDLIGHTNSISSISFSENGYSFASASSDGTVKVWDLRKTSLVRSHEVGSPLSSVSFDYSGQYLAFAAENRIYLHVVKDWEQIKQLDCHTKMVTALCWGKTSSSIISTSADRTIKINGSS